MDLKEHRTVWVSAFNEWVELEYEVTQASNALAARVNASPLGLSTPYFLDDFESIDIDTELEFYMGEFLYNRIYK